MRYHKEQYLASIQLSLLHLKIYDISPESFPMVSSVCLVLLEWNILNEITSKEKVWLAHNFMLQSVKEPRRTGYIRPRVKLSGAATSQLGPHLCSQFPSTGNMLISTSVETLLQIHDQNSVSQVIIAFVKLTVKIK